MKDDPRAKRRRATASGSAATAVAAMAGRAAAAGSWRVGAIGACGEGVCVCFHVGRGERREFSVPGMGWRGQCWPGRGGALRGKEPGHTKK